MRLKSTVFPLLLILGLIISQHSWRNLAIAAPSVAEGREQSAPLVTTLPVIADFESGSLAGWFTYGDWAGGAVLDKSVVVTNTLSTLGTPENKVLQVSYNAAGWGVGVGINLPAQDWSTYDGLRFWFRGQGTGTVFKIIITDNGGERLATKFSDTSTGWRELTFPWQVFYRDPDWQPGGEPNDGLTLTEVTALAFAPAAPSSGSFAMDAITLFKTTGAGVNDFESGSLAGWFTYGDWDGGAVLDKSVVVTNTLSTLGAPENKVLQVSYTAAGWGVGVGTDLVPAQDWSAYDGLRFWFRGQGTGTVFKIIITDNGGERLATKFTDTSSGWRELTFPWQVFYRDPDWQPGGEPNDGLTLTEVTALAFAPAAPSSGSFAMDAITLFKTNGAGVNDFESGSLAGWFTYGDWDGGAVLDKSVVVTNTLSTLGAPENKVLQVTYTAAGWGVGVGIDLAPAQDWSTYDGLRFWFRGQGTGTVFKIIITDNGGERLATKFTDTSSGWRELTFPWQVFYHDPDWQPDGAPNDGLTLTGVTALAFAPAAPSSGSFAMDAITLFKTNAGPTPLKVQFSAPEYTVVEGRDATIQVSLSRTETFTVTVDYATADGTAQAGVDYEVVTGTLVFPPDTLTQTFTVPTLDNASEDGERTVLLTLNNPDGAQLGPRSQATLIIKDNEAADLCRRLMVTVDDFESGELPQGQHGAIGIGFVTWSDGSPVAISPVTIPAGDPLARSGQVGDNGVIKFDATIGSWGGFSHLFMNETGDTWVSQDWSRYAGIGFWLYGEGDGTGLFFEIKDNRTGSDTRDDAEIWTYPFTDDVAGWRYIEIPFSAFTRKEIGNGAPNDGFGRTEVHGWAFGSLTTGGAQTLYLDDVVLLERVTVVDDFEAGLPAGHDAYGNGLGFVTWGDTWNGTSVTIADPLIPVTDTLALPCQMGSNRLLQVNANVISWGGLSHAFANPALDTWVTQDWSTYEGVGFWFYGTGSGTQHFFDIADNRNPDSTRDDAERYNYSFTDDVPGWRFIRVPFSAFTRKDIGNGAPNDGLTLTEVHGWALGSLATNGAKTYYVDNILLYGDSRKPALTVAFAKPEINVVEGYAAVLTVTLNYTTTEPVTVSYSTAESSATPYRDFVPVSGTVTIPAGELTASFELPTLDDAKAEGYERVAVVLANAQGAELGFQRRTVVGIEDNDPVDPDLLDDFEGFHPFSTVTGLLQLHSVEIPQADALALPGQGAYEHVLSITAESAGSLIRTYPLAQDWSGQKGLSFWFYGTNSGKTVTVQLLDNKAAQTGEVAPSEWVLAWSQEFNDPAGTVPDPNVWTHEIGDGALNGIVGWGNSELQYYTDRPENAAMDGEGNLRIRMEKVDPETTDLVCHYGPCEYTSARLITANKLAFAYGRIEARIKVPAGAGLWPAFWMLGTNISEVGWPQSGEIDIMEYVGRVPNEIFGTIHGPGYSGGNGFGKHYNLGQPVADAYHTFAVEWAPNIIRWYVDGIHYHSATPEDVAPNEWVFNHPFYLILNLAIGGNFGGKVDPELTFPRDMLVDYVRVYQAADTAERFEASFTDNFTGWRKVWLPFRAFQRSAEQPAGAPNDGLTLREVWGYGFKVESGSWYLDQTHFFTPEETWLPLIFKNARPQP